MAIFTAGAATTIDMHFTAATLSSFVPVVKTASQIVLAFGVQQIEWLGNFTYDGGGNITGGAVNQHTEYVNGVFVGAQYVPGIALDSISGMSVPAVNAEAFRVGNDYQGFITAALSGNDTITSNSSASGNDFLLGFTGNDAITSFAGNDTTDGGDGNDSINGGDGNDSLSGSGGADVIAGGNGDDWLNGENGNSALAVGQVAGNDTIDGAAGDDTVLGGDGDDQITGGDGTDVLVGEGGNDVITGQGGIDYVDGRQGDDQLFGGDGNDILFGDGLTTTYGFGSDILHGENGDDIIMGESGDHNAPGAADQIYGDDGNDLLYGGTGDDFILGGNGNDTIDGGTGNDYIVGGAGTDLMVGSGDSTNVGGPSFTTGNDLFAYTAMADAGDTIYGFDTRAGNTDGFDLRPLFDALGYTGTAARADGWLTVTTGNTPADSVVWVDPNGGANSFVPLVTVAGVAPAVLTDAFFLIQ